jgi:hypothetical protein
LFLNWLFCSMDGSSELPGVGSSILCSNVTWGNTLGWGHYWNCTTMPVMSSSNTGLLPYTYRFDQSIWTIKLLVVSLCNLRERIMLCATGNICELEKSHVELSVISCCVERFDTLMLNN